MLYFIGAAPRRRFIPRVALVALLLASFVALCGCAVAPSAAVESTPAPTATPLPDRKEIYRDFFGRVYGWENENTETMFNNHENKYNAFLVDVTQDGENELIVTDDTSGDLVEIRVYTVYNGEVRLLFSDESSYNPHAKIFGLYVRDGQTYLFVGENNMWQGSGNCSYRIFSLTPSGKERVLLQDTHSEQIGTDYGEVSDAYYDFLGREEQALRQTLILFHCEECTVLQSSPAAVLN